MAGLPASRTSLPTVITFANTLSVLAHFPHIFLAFICRMNLIGCRIDLLLIVRVALNLYRPPSIFTTNNASRS